ncbi:MAG: methyltransferase [Candidatus Coatesbacteria bacterium]|nr:methyltransferase [Candidatus Coatesbacteria bacterium]
MRKFSIEFKGRENFKEKVSDIELVSMNGMSPQDKILLKEIEKTKNLGEILVILDSQGFITGILRMLNPDNQITSWNYDKYSIDNLKYVMKANDLKKITYSCMKDLPEKKFDTIFLSTKAEGITELIQDIIIQCFNSLKLNGKLFLSTNNPEDRFFQRNMKEAFGSVTIADHSRRARLYISRKHSEKQIPDKSKIWRIDFNFRGKEFVFKTRAGIFSHKEIDEGSLALLEILIPSLNEIPDFQSIADIGCGYGILGIVSASFINPSELLLMDSNTRAISMTKENVKLNKLKPDKLIIVDSQEKSGEDKYSLALINPPYYGNFKIARRLLQIASEILLNDGVVFMVGKEKKNHQAIMEEFFKEITITDRRGFSIFKGNNKK